MDTTGKKIVGRLVYFTVQAMKTIFFMPHGSCRFEPSCSHYAQEAANKFSLFKALYLIFRRIIKCHPFSQGGYDPLP